MRALKTVVISDEGLVTLSRTLPTAAALGFDATPAKPPEELAVNVYTPLEEDPEKLTKWLLDKIWAGLYIEPAAPFIIASVAPLGI